MDLAQAWHALRDRVDAVVHQRPQSYYAEDAVFQSRTVSAHVRIEHGRVDVRSSKPWTASGASIYARTSGGGKRSVANSARGPAFTAGQCCHGYGRPVQQV
jgi:hypothetical protein